MNIPRQDAWTKDEDIILAETVLRYIREGKTQLEAFKKVAKTLSRTSAACGFRWNATIRKQYEQAIQLAREERKLESQKKNWSDIGSTLIPEHETIDKTILLLKKMKLNTSEQGEVEKAVKQLQIENQQLKQQLQRYDQAWIEMKKLWSWVKQPTEE